MELESRRRKGFLMQPHLSESVTIKNITTKSFRTLRLYAQCACAMILLVMLEKFLSTYSYLVALTQIVYTYYEGTVSSLRCNTRNY